MAYKKLNKKFDAAYLKQLKEEENSCVELQRKELHLTVHPFQLKDLAYSVKEILSTRTARYNAELGGILLGYDNVVIKSTKAEINYDICYMHVSIEGDFYVFKPEVGKLLKGVVNKKSHSHVGCLVYQLFNVTLPSPEEDESWLGDRAALGQEVLFRIVNTNLNRKLPYIQGEITLLIDSDSGISTGEENSHNPIADDCSDQEQQQQKKRKKHKHKTKEALPSEDLVDENEVLEDVSQGKRKTKNKRKSFDEAECSHINKSELEQESPTKKKKRHRKSDPQASEESEIHSGVAKESTTRKQKKSKGEHSEEPDATFANVRSSKKRKRESVEMEEAEETMIHKKRHKRSDA